MDKPAITLFLGGARSGKSRRAEELAARLAGELGLPVCYIATALAADDEMAARISHHRRHRPPEWETLEAPDNAAEQLRARSKLGPCIFLLDCLTVLVSNWLLRFQSAGLNGEKLIASVLQRVDELVVAMQESGQHCLVVSNETGMGIVPAYPLGRVFRDAAGWANQKVAAAAARTYLVVAGKVLNLSELEVEW